MNMGIEPFLVASSVHLICAQRLVRRVCSNCKEPHPLAPAALVQAGYNPEDAYAYDDASYGYDGYYVDLSEYQNYFREGFRRGYEDGYRQSSRYGRYNNGTGSILGAILEGILGLQLLN